MSEAPRTAGRGPSLDLPGAVAADGAHGGVAAHFGELVREQRAWQAGDAVADLSHLAVLSVAGPDRLSWLHSLMSAKFDDLAPGESRETLVLDPHGHIEHAAAVLDDGEITWLITEPDRAPALRAWLEAMRFMRRVEVADAAESWAVLGRPGGVGNAAPDALEPADGVRRVWRDPWPGVVPGGTSYAPDLGHPGHEWCLDLHLVRRDQVAQRWSSLMASGVTPVGAWALEALRVAAWRPCVAREVDDHTLPHELDWLRTAVHLSKGCYRGQETVAKVINVGHPPRRLVELHLDGSGHVLPEIGAAVSAQGEVVGRLTSVGLHAMDGPIALALVRRRMPEDAPLEVAGVAAAQVVVVPARGESAARPDIPRGATLGLARKPRS